MFGIKQSFVFFYVSSRQVHVVLDTDILRTNSINIVASGSYRNNSKLPIFRPFKEFCGHGILMTQGCDILCRGSIVKHPVFCD